MPSRVRGPKPSLSASEPRGNYLLEVRLQRERVPSFDRYPFCLPAVQGLTRLALSRPVTFLVGENGSGKSTLLEAIAIAWGFNPEGGSKNFRFATRVSHSELHDYLTLSRSHLHARDGFFLRAESFYNVASEIDRLGVTRSYGGLSLHAQSHGEAFMKLFTERFQGRGLYLLDEPEAALSPTRQLSLLTKLHELVQADSQLIVSTHSPILLAYPDAQILQLEASGLRPVPYEETEHFQVTRQFVNHYPAMLRELLG